MTYTDNEAAERSDDQRDRRNDPILFKKYFKSRSSEGFLTLKPWFEALKVSIDIGSVRNGSLQSNTLAYANAFALATFLRAVVNGSAETLYPANESAGLLTPESWIVYGGGDSGGRTVARVVKIHRWMASEADGGDPGFFAWKTGSFVGRRTSTGAVVPDTRQVISQDMIKISRQEMHEISYRLDLALYSYGARVGEQLWIKK